MNGERAPVFTMGHSTRTARGFVSLLKEYGIARLVDVRRYPGSRRHPQFNAEALEATLADAGVAYVHEADLGGRRSGRRDSPNTAWRQPGFRAYADYATTPAFRNALARVVAWAAAERVALMCAEAVPWRCHRQVIADHLAARGIPVRHILGPGQSRGHELHPAAHVQSDGSIVYRGPGSGQLGLLSDRQ